MVVMPSDDSASHSHEETSRESDDSDSSDSRVVDRRTILEATAGLSAVTLAGCTGNGPSSSGGTESTPTSSNTASNTGSNPDYSGQTLSVATWAGIYADAFEKSVAKMFEERTGATVEVNPAGGSILSEIKSAPEDNPPYDVAAAEGFFYWQGRKENLFLEIDKQNIPNLDNVYSSLKDIRGTKYGVPTDGSLNGIVYRKDIGWEPSAWTDLLSDKKGTDRIGFEGSWYIYPFEVAASSLSKREGIAELYHEQDHQAVFDRMQQFGKNVKLWTGSFAEIETNLLQQIIHMSMWYSGMGNAAAASNDKLEFVTPEKTAGYLDHYCPVRGTDKKGMAEDFLNHMLDPKVQTEWAKQGYVYNSNMEASYPDRVADQYPTTNDEWKQIAIADYSKLKDYSSKFSSKFQEIKG